MYGLLDESTSIGCFMAKQSDFLEQETLLQYYAKQLGVESDRSPVYHPEIAGEGIEFNLGCSNVYYRAQPWIRSKDKFYTLVDECLGPTVVTLTLCCNYAHRARSYKALEDTYNNEEDGTETKDTKTTSRYNHTLIEKCVSLFCKRRSHCNPIDFDTKYCKTEVMKNILSKMIKLEPKIERVEN